MKISTAKIPHHTFFSCFWIIFSRGTFSVQVQKCKVRGHGVGKAASPRDSLTSAGKALQTTSATNTTRLISNVVVLNTLEKDF